MYEEELIIYEKFLSRLVSSDFVSFHCGKGIFLLNLPV